MTTTTFSPAVHQESTASVARRVATTKYATEAIGTFFLVFAVGAAVRSGSPLAPVAIGATLMAMIYAGGHISGAHYNPAVTIAALVRGRIEMRDAIAYWVAQIAGGLMAATVAGIVVPKADVAPLAFSGHGAVAAFVAELVVTFALCYVVLNVATSKDHPDNSFYGLAIGFTVAAGAVTVGGVSGGVFNPAVAFSGVAMGMFAGSTLWIYLTAQVLAGIAAGIAFRAINPTDK